MEHLKQFGKYLTPAVIDMLGVPLPPLEFRVGDKKHTSPISQIECDTHVVLSYLMLNHVYSEERQYKFLDVMDCITRATDELRAEGPWTDENSIMIVRGEHLKRENIHTFTRASAHFIDHLYDKTHYFTNFLSVHEHLHPFVQFLYLCEYMGEAAKRMDQAIVGVPPVTTTQNELVLEALRKVVIPELFPANITNEQLQQVIINVTTTFTKNSEPGYNMTGTVIVNPNGHCEVYIAK